MNWCHPQTRGGSCSVVAHTHRCLFLSLPISTYHYALPITIMPAVLFGPVAYDGGFPGLKSTMDPKEHFYRHFEANATSTFNLLLPQAAPDETAN